MSDFDLATRSLRKAATYGSPPICVAASIVGPLLIIAMLAHPAYSYADDIHGTAVGAICGDGSSHPAGFDCQSYLCATGWAQSNGLGAYCPSAPSPRRPATPSSQTGDSLGPQDEANSQFQLGISQYNNHQWKEAISAFKAALVEEPNNSQIQHYLDLAQNQLSEQEFEENTARAQKQFLQNRDSTAALLKTDGGSDLTLKSSPAESGLELKTTNPGIGDSCSQRSQVEQAWLTAETRLLDTRRRIQVVHGRFVQSANAYETQAGNLASDEENLDKLNEALDKVDDGELAPLTTDESPSIPKDGKEVAEDLLSDSELDQYRVLARGALAWTEVVIKSKAKYDLYERGRDLTAISQDLHTLSKSLVQEVSTLQMANRELKATTDCDTTQLILKP